MLYADPSGVPINISELKLAGGAVGRGTTDQISVDISSRYEAALQGLSGKLSTEIKAIIDNAATVEAGGLFSKQTVQAQGQA